MKNKIVYNNQQIKAKVIDDFLPDPHNLHLYKKYKRKSVDKKFLKILNKVVEEHSDVLKELAKR